jgi:hypothetical protein
MRGLMVAGLLMMIWGMATPALAEHRYSHRHESDHRKGWSSRAPKCVQYT